MITKHNREPGSITKDSRRRDLQFSRPSRDCRSSRRVHRGVVGADRERQGKISHAVPSQRDETQQHRTAEFTDEIGCPGAHRRDVVEEQLDDSVVRGMRESRGPYAAGPKAQPSHHSR